MNTNLELASDCSLSELSVPFVPFSLGGSSTFSFCAVSIGSGASTFFSGSGLGGGVGNTSTIDALVTARIP